MNAAMHVFFLMGDLEGYFVVLQLFCRKNETNDVKDMLVKHSYECQLVFQKSLNYIYTLKNAGLF